MAAWRMLANQDNQTTEEGNQQMKRITRVLFTALLAGGLVGTALPGTVFADTDGNANASCMGHEASAVSPAGAEDGPFSQEGMPGILTFVDQVVIPAFDFKNRGEAISGGPAQINSDRTLSTHHECDEALGIPEGGE
jgi:hypothetical protein